jgi:hypothetical protein
MVKNKIHRAPDQDKRKGFPEPPKPKQNRPDSTLNTRDSNETPSIDSNDSENNEPSGEMRRSVTNHDEQNKATNASGNDQALDEKETEGV